MNDSDLMVSLRDSLADVHLNAPVAEVMRTGSSLRRRRGITRFAAASLAIVMAGAAVISWATSSDRATSGPNRTVLAAWTVKTTSTGSIAVTVRQLTDFAGLQTKLRSDGIPALITTSFALPASCNEWMGGDYSSASIITLANESGLPTSGGVEFSIQPHSIPDGSLLWLGLAQTGAPPGSDGPAGPMSVGLFTNTSACAGASGS